MTNILEKIIQEKKESLNLIKKDYSLDYLEKKIKDLNFFYNFKETIQNNKKISLIAEIKKASPSAGVIVQNFSHLDIAKMCFTRAVHKSDSKANTREPDL